MNGLFNKKAIAAVTAFTAVIAVLPTWTSIQHDKKIRSAFLSQTLKDTSKRVLTIQVDGVTREGYLSPGAAMPNINLGFYNHPTNSLVIANSSQAACWYANMKVTSGSEDLPFWQKLFGGAEYESVFANQSFSGLWSYNCAPK